MNVVAYLRVSTEQQVGSGLGLEAQRASIEDYAAKHEWSIGEFLVDSGISGTASLENRPSLVKALGQVENGTVLLVSKLDRLSRDPLVLLLVEDSVKRSGGRIVSTAGEGTDSDEPSQVLLRRILSAVAENEAKLVSIRTKAALKAKQARGEWVGRPPFGFKVEDGVLVKGDKYSMASTVVSYRAAGFKLREIVGRMETMFPGHKWSITKVTRILRHSELLDIN
jgi:DNA invertase Pin-like site-specific DNA recombinase